MSFDASPRPPARKRTPIGVWIGIANAALMLLVIAAVVLYWSIGDSHRALKPSVPPSPAVGAERGGPDQRPVAASFEKPSPKPLSVAEVIEQVDHAVVLISCKDSKGAEIGLGSGFVIDPSGLVASNFHVFRKASKAEATFVDGTKVEFKGCRAWDADGDLMILELTRVPKGVKVVKLCGDTTRKQAADVIAIGHPQGFKFTTTTGIISAVHKTAELPKPYRNYIEAPPENIWLQTNAAISGGSSGGPLLNMQGEVIGITTWIAAGQNLGFATDIRHLIALRAKVDPKVVPLAELTGPEESLDALIGQFNNQYEYFQQEVGKTWTRAAAQKLIETRHPALDYLPKFYEFAVKYRRTPIALRALETICQVAGKIVDCPPACNATLKLTADRIVEDYKSDARLVSAVLALIGTSLDEGQAIIRRVAKESKNRRVQGIALFALAMSLSREEDPKKKADKKKPEDQQKRTDEAVALLERVSREFADVEIIDQQLGKVAEPLLFQLKYLAVGRIPLDIVGKDADGKELKLSDYRGKVVVLDFWVDWCPHCVQMYPLERELVKRYQDKPFAIVGVNCDEPGRLRRVLDAKTVTWRSWADGPQGPISQKWRVEGFPTLYVLDHEGVIRYKQVRGGDLENAVAELLKKAPASGGKPDAKAEPPGAARADTPAKPSSSSQQMRTWKRKDGKKAELRFAAVEGENVQLQRADGKTFLVPLKDLSDEDRQWVGKQGNK